MVKRKFKNYQQYINTDEVDDPETQEEEQTLLFMNKARPKGLGKGKGKPYPKGKGKGGNRDQHRHIAPQLSFDRSKGKGKVTALSESVPIEKWQWGMLASCSLCRLLSIKSLLSRLITS